MWSEDVFAGCSCWVLQLQLLTPVEGRGVSAITTDLNHHGPKSREELIAEDWTVQSSLDRNQMVDVMVAWVWFLRCFGYREKKNVRLEQSNLPIWSKQVDGMIKKWIKTLNSRWTLWYISEVAKPRKLRLEDHEFRVRLGYIVRPNLNKMSIEIEIWLYDQFKEQCCPLLLIFLAPGLLFT